MGAGSIDLAISWRSHLITNSHLLGLFSWCFETESAGKAAEGVLRKHINISRECSCFKDL